MPISGVLEDKLSRSHRGDVLSQSHEPLPENETVLRERLAGMSQASLRINESLDLDVVLQGVLDSARSLTGVSYGAFVLLDVARTETGALVKSDYTPIVTTDPEEALRLVYEKRPHVVLLDLVLPGADGMELMKDIVERTEAPVIFLSAHG